MSFADPGIIGTLPTPNTDTVPVPSLSSGSTRLRSFLQGVKFERGGALIPGGGLISMEAFSDLLKRQAAAFGATQADILSAVKGAGLNYGVGADGTVRITGPAGGGGASATPAPVGTTPPGFQAPTVGGGTSSGGGSFGGGGGGASGRPAGGGFAGPGGMPTYGQMPGGGSGGSIPAFGGAGSGGSAGMSWNDPLGFKNPGPGPGALPGAGYQSGAFAYGKPRSIFDGLPQNPTFGDVVGQVMRRQEDNRDAALGILGNTRNEITNDPNRALLRARTGDLLANPYSLDEATISRILGKTNEGITQRAAEMGGLARDRAAASGVLRSGAAASQEDAIRNNAASAMASGERDIRVQAAIQNGQDLRSAMAAALPGINEETTQKANLDTTAARDVLGGTQYMGDAFLSSALMGKKQGTLVNEGASGINLGGGPVLRF